MTRLDNSKFQDLAKRIEALCQSLQGVSLLSREETQGPQTDALIKGLLNLGSLQTEAVEELTGLFETAMQNHEECQTAFNEYIEDRGKA